MRRTVALLVGFAISALPSAAASAQDAAAFYEDNCAFCHTGAAPRGGPTSRG